MFLFVLVAKFKVVLQYSTDVLLFFILGLDVIHGLPQLDTKRLPSAISCLLVTDIFTKDLFSHKNCVFFLKIPFYSANPISNGMSVNHL